MIDDVSVVTVKDKEIEGKSVMRKVWIENAKNGEIKS